MMINLLKAGIFLFLKKNMMINYPCDCEPVPGRPPPNPARGPSTEQAALLQPRRGGGFFIFYFFCFCFLQKYIFVFKIYRNIPRPPRYRAAGTWSPRCGAAGAFMQKLLRKYLRAGPWGAVARQRGGWPPRPPGSWAASSCRATASITSFFFEL